MVEVDSLEVGVDDHRNRMMPGHGIGLVPYQRPDGEESVLAVEREHRVDHVVDTVGLGDGVERVGGTERVPQ